jgi:pro-kumamolisin-like protein/Big-like domain-containing protein
MAGSLLALAGVRASAQPQGVRARITEAIDETNVVRLRGNVHPLARAEFDQGVIADSQPVNRMLLLLQRSPEQQAALSNLMEEQLTKSSPNFHKWLTPEEFGTQFGPADADIQTVTAWLGSHGFQAIKVSKGRTTIEFSGNVGQVRNAFHTEMHRFVVKGEEQVANVSDPQIPAALAPVVRGVVSLHNFRKRPHLHPVGTFRRTKATGELKPLFTFTPNGGTQQFAVGPPDFATIYDVPNGVVPLKSGQTKLDGTNQTIAVVGRTNINLQDVADFRNLFGLPVNPPNVILNGPDPGNVGGGEELEADLDVQWSGAVAPNATIDFVVTETPQSNLSDGVDLSAIYIVDNNLAGVMSESFGSCELQQGTAGNQFQNALWEQAAAEGISVTVSSGDSGSAGCDGGTETAATMGIAISGTASTPFNVAVGGTDFDDVGNTATFWNPTNTNPGQESAKGYIPETTWNDSCAANGLTSCTTVNSNGNDIVAGSGGPSNCTTPSGTTPSTCSGAYAKPAYQKLAGLTGIPVDGVRDIPDVSLFASDGNHGSAYIVCQADSNPAGQTGSCNLNSPFQDFVLVGGTSAPTPSFAGVLALVNQKVTSIANPAPRQGNANAVLYQLAAAEAASLSSCNSSNRTSTTCVFNDISTQATKSTISVACKANSPNCSNTGTSGFGVIVNPSNTKAEAWNAGVGYDLATGLGSVDVTNLTNAWATAASAVKPTPTTTLTISPNPVVITHGQPVNVSFAVTSGSGTPTGGVVLETSPNPNNAALSTGLGIESFPLVNGVACNPAACAVNLLPGGAYSVFAHYSGDTKFGSSDSTPIAVTVSKESSKSTIALVAFDAAGNQSVQTNVAYGSPYILLVNVTNSSGTPCFPTTGSVVTPPLPCPTGNVKITDNGSGITDFNGSSSANLNNQGILEDQPVQLPPGMHGLVATYAGDNSFSGSTSLTDTVTITQATTTTAVTASPTSITSGSMVTLTATVSTQSNGVAPGGALTTPVQFLNGSTPITGTITLKAVNGSTSNATLTATLTTTITAFGLPERPSPGRPNLPPGAYWVLAACAALYGLFLWKMPAKRRREFAYAGLALFALAAAGIAGCGGGGKSGPPPPRTVTITAKFAGDTNYMASSGMTTVSVQ